MEAFSTTLESALERHKQDLANASGLLVLQLIAELVPALIKNRLVQATIDWSLHSG